MRYLDKRNDFIKSKVNENITRSSEASGPFANDLGWHDSLLGRFINHLIRKGQIKYRAGKIKDLTKRLEETFDALVAQNAILSLDTESQEMVKKITLYSIFHDLKEAVENGEDLETIKYLTERSIDVIEGKELKEQIGDFKEKDQLLKELNKFLEYLKSLDVKEDKEETKISQEELDQLMISNLSTLLQIMKTFGSNTEVKKEKVKFDKNTIKIGGYYLRADKEGKPRLIKVVGDDKTSGGKIEDGYVLVVYYMPEENSWRKMTTAVSKDKIFKEVRVSGDTLNQEDIKIVSKNPVKTTALVSKGTDTNESLIIESNGEISDDIKNQLKSSILLLTKNDKGFSITTETLESLISNFRNNPDSTRFIIDNLYKEIFSCLKGRRSKTVSDVKLSESFDTLSKDQSKIPVMGELIAKFAKISGQFEEGKLYTKLGDTGNLLHKFNETLNKIIDSGIGEPNYNKTKEEVKESKLFRYDSFITYIKEADEPEDREATFEPNTLSTKIKDFFDRYCKGIKTFVIEKTEVDKINKNLDQISKQDVDNFYIDGMDPVIEIVKLFNKAYKLFTFPYMTKRTGASGGVGVTTAGQYTALGGASSDGRQGPYRNNKIFDIWEDAVNDIFKNRKYQHIFLPTAKMRLPKVPNPRPDKKEDYIWREKAGANLRKFMLDILDGENLYKLQSSSGKQKEFINKYFGEVDENTGKQIGLADGEVIKLQKQESEVPTTKIKFSNAGNIKGIIKEGHVISIKGTNKDGKGIQRHFMIKSLDSGYVYLIMSKSFGRLKKYIDRLDGKREFEKGDFTDIYTTDNGAIYTKIKQSDFSLLLKDGGVKITSVNSDKETKEEVISITDSYWLTAENEGELSIFNSSTNKDQLNSIIDQLGDKSNIESFISSVSNSDSIKITKS